MTLRSLLPALAGFAIAAALVAPPAAQAQSRALYVTGVSGLDPEDATQTLSRFVVEGRNNANALVGQRVCSVFGPCDSFFAGAAKSVVVLELDTAREVAVSETCKGVASTVPQLRCDDGDLVVRIRRRTGEIQLRHVTTTPAAGPTLRLLELAGVDLRFAEDARRTRRMAVVANGTYPAVAGRYVANPAGSMGGHCRPALQTPDVAVDVPEGGRATLEFVWRGTECLVNVLADVAPAELALRSDTASFACTELTPSSTSPFRSDCTARAPFNQPMTISANAPAGRQPNFRVGGNNHCSALQPDRTKCLITPTRDLFLYSSGTREFITMETLAVGAPPAPEPVALGFTRGASSPADAAVAKGTVAVPMLQLRGTATNGTALLGALVLKASGSGRDDLDLARVRLVADANGNGMLDAGETVLAEARPTADNGEFSLAPSGALPIAAGTDLLVVADIAGDVHQAAAGAVTGLVLALGLVAWPVVRGRRMPRPMAAALVSMAVLAALSACGGGDDDAEAAPPVAGAPSAPAAPPVHVTYRLDLTAIRATDSGTPPRSLDAALTVEGATVTVQK